MGETQAEATGTQFNEESYPTGGVQEPDRESPLSSIEIERGPCPGSGASGEGLLEPQDPCGTPARRIGAWTAHSGLQAVSSHSSRLRAGNSCKAEEATATSWPAPPSLSCSVEMQICGTADLFAYSSPPLLSQPRSAVSFSIRQCPNSITPSESEVACLPVLPTPRPLFLETASAPLLRLLAVGAVLFEALTTGITFCPFKASSIASTDRCCSEKKSTNPLRAALHRQQRFGTTLGSGIEALRSNDENTDDKTTVGNALASPVQMHKGSTPRVPHKSVTLSSFSTGYALSANARSSSSS